MSCSKTFLLLCFLLPFNWCFSQPFNSNNKPQLGTSSIKSIISEMTLEEKIQVVVGAGLDSQASQSDDGIIGDVKGRVQGAAGSTNSLPKYGIPEMILSDGPAGLRIDPIRHNDSINTYYATAWPVGLLLASSWDTTLIASVGKALGNEAKEYGVDVLLAPGMNLIRDPLNGRNFEYYSEDPLLSGFIGAAYVKGVQSNGVGSTIKHFVANNQESNRLNVNVNVSERALRELYLRGFEIAVKQASPLWVMSSYNKVNGTYTPESYDLLTTILRKEWGFKGGVMTDWGGGRNTVEQMRAGNDLIMPGAEFATQTILKAVKNGSLDEKILDENVERILALAVNSLSFKKYNYNNTPDLNGHAVLARKAASEGIVLLKNTNNTLPIVKINKLALFGCASYDTFTGGTGSGEVYSKDNVSIVDGLKNAGFNYDSELELRYDKHITQDKIDFPRPKKTLGKVRITPEIFFSKEQIEEVANNNDIAIFTIGRQIGEGKDVDVEDGFNLNELEKEQIKTIAEIFHAKNKKLVVIINAGGAIETVSWHNSADAILLPWKAGQESGNAIADVLNGLVNPSGKLTVTFPKKYEDVSSSNNFPGTPAKRPKQVNYEEGVYVGYRYFNSFNIEPAYEFGFGLSYTQFEYRHLKLSSKKFKDFISVSITVTNTGHVAGKEVVQLYLSAPAASLDRPEAELKGFAKTALLAPGASQTVTFKLSAKDLASYVTDQSAWIAEAGKYAVKIGASSKDIKQTSQFALKQVLLVEKVNKVLTPQIAISELIHKK
ncbi:glycosyl hydrolase [Labilibaculum manganireducens]|uniref:Glycosyl hydrolase n=1 Tax=Labilibaculum manganireducens TaxID=1940525 RepID=A0A2N3I6R4_9BACT|nr:glycoside hydrolase family 3 C-terminal domain-containing protein [Labilibaculum manganireducens]PKQ66008.1 glycosyl hydrolase [Labilibaculum manganireducens]